MSFIAYKNKSCSKSYSSIHEHFVCSGFGEYLVSEGPVKKKEELTQTLITRLSFDQIFK